MLLYNHSESLLAYRPPDSTNDTNQLLISAVDWLANDSVRVCIVGDLNLPAFNWEQFLYMSSKLYDLFADFISSHGLSQIVDQPTRGNSILDVVLCSDVLCCDDVEVLPPISTSDHNTVCFKLCLHFTQQHFLYKRITTQAQFCKGRLGKYLQLSCCYRLACCFLRLLYCRWLVECFHFCSLAGYQQVCPPL